MLTPGGCRARQSRLLKKMAAQRWDLFVTANHRTVYYFTGQLLSADVPCAFLVWQNERTALIAPAVDNALADEKRQVEVYSPGRAITFPHQDAAVLLNDFIAGRPASRVGVDRTSTASPALGALAGEDASGMVLALRRRKERDEVEAIRESLRLCEIAYDAARRVIRPGVTELDVYLEMYAAIARGAGAPVLFPGDFACGERSIRGGGPPTTRILQPGDLFPLDLFPAPALYFGDTCRTFCVGEPSATQSASWRLVCDALRLGESLVKPGASGREIYGAIKQFLDDAEMTEKSFWHHAGHGIGLHGHEAPRLIRDTEDVLEPGDVFTLEPGVYTAANQGGIRLENNYLCTENGIRKLFDYPLDLAL